VQRDSILQALNLPAGFGETLLTVSLVLTLVPYAAGLKLGPLEIPRLPAAWRNRLRYVGPLLFLGAVGLHLPFLPAGRPPILDEILVVARGRVSDISTRCDNLLLLAKEIKEGQIGEAAPHNRVNDLNNGVVDLWRKAASYGIGADPYTDHIQVSGSGFVVPEVGSDFGADPRLRAIGLPRLLAECSKVRSSDSSAAVLVQTLADFTNPQIYPQRDFNERAYDQYRIGVNIGTQTFASDLEHLSEWLARLRAGLHKARELFDEACE
jgi:hypothetical protein